MSPVCGKHFRGQCGITSRTCENRPSDAAFCITQRILAVIPRKVKLLIFLVYMYPEEAVSLPLAKVELYATHSQSVDQHTLKVSDLLPTWGWKRRGEHSLTFHKHHFSFNAISSKSLLNPDLSVAFYLFVFCAIFVNISTMVILYNIFDQKVSNCSSIALRSYFALP